MTSTNPPPAGKSERKISLLRLIIEQRDPLSFLSNIAHLQGDFAHVKVGKRSIVVLKHPDHVQQLLVADSGRTEKGRTVERALFFLFLGEGLLNSTGESHRRQRRLVLPAFHRTRLVTYSRMMVAAARAMSENWSQGEKDLSSEMMALTLEIVSRTLFSSDVEGTARNISSAFSELTANVNRMGFPGARLLLKSPLPFARRVRAAEQTLNSIVNDLIRKRRQSGEDKGDLLSMLLLAEDSERPGEHLGDSEVRDQVMTLLFGGHETTANALTWTWWLLAQHPDVERKLHAEIESVIGDREPEFTDIPKLVFTEQIVREVLRLYPPIWAMGRRALEDLDFRGHKVPRNSLVVASQWLMHRDTRWFSDPNSFIPTRWSSEFRATLPRFAYFPFGGGPRSCIGENFAWAELILVIVAVAQTWKFSMTPQSIGAKPLARITLHANREVQLLLTRRTNPGVPI
jgi:cytochrome P450